jgi:hypothetical protein
MKQRSVVVSLILVAVVLLAAYGLGLLIRQARLGDSEPASPPAAEPNDIAKLEKLVPGRRSGQSKPKPTPEQLAAAKQQRAGELAEAGTLTEEQKQERREALRAQLRTASQEPGRLPHLSPEELEELGQKWPQMSEEERIAYRAAMSEKRPARLPRIASPNDANEPAQKAEPNAAGQN